MLSVPGIRPPAATGRLIARKNRFVVSVEVAGDATTASLPNPGKLEELFVQDALLALARGPEGGRHPYRVVAVESDLGTIFLDTGKTNAVAAELLRRRMIPAFSDYEVERMEVPLPETPAVAEVSAAAAGLAGGGLAARGGGAAAVPAAPEAPAAPKSRIDMKLSGPHGSLYLEVKSCTLFNGRFAMFPDAVTERGRRHLLELSRRRDSALLFVVHSDRPDFFFPDFHNDLAFARAFRDAGREMPIYTVGVRWNRQLGIERVRNDIEIPWRLLDGRVADRGSYLVLLHLARRTEITVGALGRLSFSPGYYLYVGSAQSALSKRLERHRRQGRKRLHWHIDYLREQAEWVCAYPIRSRARREAEIARAFAALADGAVPAFGSSDSPEPSHLFRFRGDPRRRRDFQAALLHERRAGLEEEL